MQLVSKMFNEVWRGVGNLSAQLDSEFTLFKRVNVELIEKNQNPNSFQGKQFFFILDHISHNEEKFKSVVGHVTENRSDNPYLLDAVKEISRVLKTEIKKGVYCPDRNQRDQLTLLWNQVGERAGKDVLAKRVDRNESILVDQICKLYQGLVDLGEGKRSRLFYFTAQFLGEKKEFFDQIKVRVEGNERVEFPVGFKVLIKRKKLEEGEEPTLGLLQHTISAQDSVGFKEVLKLLNFDKYSKEQIEKCFEKAPNWQITEMLLDALKEKLQRGEVPYSGVLCALHLANTGLCEKFIEKYYNEISNLPSEEICNLIEIAILDENPKVFQKLIQIKNLVLPFEKSRKILRSVSKKDYETFLKILMESGKLNHGKERIDRETVRKELIQLLGPNARTILQKRGLTELDKLLGGSNKRASDSQDQSDSKRKKG